MTNTQLVEIQPSELKFTFEVKKQSSCAVHIANITDHYVAFKVKITSPKKYCVRPNIGVIKPKSTYDFTVTMQSQRTAPPDMQCKDKFLIQCIVVPFGTSEEEIPPSVFNKDNGKYIEECKLKVVLVSPPQSPVLQPANGISKQGASIETSMQQEKFRSGVENFPSAHTAECIISKLKEEKRSAIKDMEILKQELALLRTKGVGRRAQVGFPQLFLCMVALICPTVGYLVHA